MSTFCKDCKYADTTPKEPKYWKCRAPEVIRIVTDLVTGETTTLDHYCELQRESCLPGNCGNAGNFFVAKQSVNAKTIVTHNISPPIPVRFFDWVAYYDGEEEGARGFGENEAEAIKELQEFSL